MSGQPAVFPRREEWLDSFRSRWLAHYEKTGEIEWDVYPRTPALDPIEAKSVVPSEARLLLVSSSGAYDPSTQSAFDAANPLGDYSTRRLALDVDAARLDFAHDHYDHTAVREDVGVLLPLELLQEEVTKGRLSSVCPRWLSFMGYQPDLARVETETLPAVLAAAREQAATAALLVPS